MNIVPRKKNSINVLKDVARIQRVIVFVTLPGLVPCSSSYNTIG